MTFAVKLKDNACMVSVYIYIYVCVRVCVCVKWVLSYPLTVNIVNADEAIISYIELLKILNSE
jgi:hypothetical protein